MLYDEDKMIRDVLVLGQPRHLAYNHQKWTKAEFVTQDTYLWGHLDHPFAFSYEAISKKPIPIFAVILHVLRR